MTPVSVQGHFGEWIQGRIGADGPIGLVTLPCPVLQVSAPGEHETLFPQDILARFARHLDLQALPSGVARNIQPGIGAGASTATLIALARAAGFSGSPEQLAEACIAAEGATDPLMFPDPDRFLWASREGRVLQALARPPRAAILGGLWGAPKRTDAHDADFDDIADLARQWQIAAQVGHLARLAAIASDSARRCTGRRGPGDPMAELARDLDALGFVRAHTGSARGLVFAPGGIPEHGPQVLQDAGFRDIIRFETGGA